MGAERTAGEPRGTAGRVGPPRVESMASSAPHAGAPDSTSGGTAGSAPDGISGGIAGGFSGGTSGTVSCTVPAAATRDEDGWVHVELEVRRSRFLGFVARVDAEEDAREMIAALRRRFHDSRHVCSAFVLGPDRRQARSNDDGEPAGTAGTPMLEALLQRQTGPDGARDLTEVCAVVVRYFGGIKLGAGGLVRAYSDAVSATLDAAPLVTRSRMALFEVAAPHAEAGRWQHELDTAGHLVQDVRYEASSAVLCAAVPDTAERIAAFQATLAAVTAGAGTAVPVGHDWVDEG